MTVQIAVTIRIFFDVAFFISVVFYSGAKLHFIFELRMESDYNIILNINLYVF